MRGGIDMGFVIGAIAVVVVVIIAAIIIYKKNH